MEKCCCTPMRKKNSDKEELYQFDNKLAKNNHPEVRFREIPGGIAYLGTNTIVGYEADIETPQYKKAIASYLIDQYAVTNRDFKRFIDDTGYKTDAERFGWSFVFHLFISEKDKHNVLQVVENTPWWCVVEGATWKHPMGPDSSIEEMMDHPVVHVSLNDANAYCEWAGTRLPTELEWEHAARGGTIDTIHPWGDELMIDGEHQCNTWQGKFPLTNTEEDGYLATASVDSYKPNAYGLYNMIGNVWEWCSDSFCSEIKGYSKQEDPGFKVLKGGSYLCHHSYCNRYRIAARIGNTKDSSTGNIGFRVIKR
ncbi:formylglycine-generating enzyme family protein [Bacillus shivajii]|uniref:formylglycine-generating enzyme family protein n=1 Tax=Bacillus shivajii TaxID=1983719 RepID=UPI001CFB15C8|nr:formylglycine-generating enzyme family protein [Bacillus shivajii]UCZ52487.1 formylglycine-generating enzyme family protein [Bacillus shivajii]